VGRTLGSSFACRVSERAAGLAHHVAIAEPAKLLASSRYPLIAGLRRDVAGARAAISLANCTGGIIDHMNAGRGHESEDDGVGHINRAGGL
jgi:formylmethanofuran dehydrogenase subunit B